MNFTALIVAIAAALPAPGYTLADEAAAQDQFVRWRSAIVGVDRSVLKFRVVHLDFFPGDRPRTACTSLGVCYREGDLWALSMVPAPISALDPMNGRQGRQPPGITSNPEVADSAISVVDGPEELCVRFVDEPPFVVKSVYLFPASALSPENTMVTFFLSENSWIGMFSPVRAIPIFWPTAIDIAQFDISQQIHEATGQGALILQRKPEIDGSYQRSHGPEYDRLVALFHEGAEVPYAISFKHLFWEIRYYFDEYQTGESADIPQDAFELLERE